MKTAVVFKWCKDPQDARLDADGTVNWGGAKLSPSDDDHAAMEVARILSSEDEIVGITFGTGKPDWAAARGAGSTVVVEDIDENSNVADIAQAAKAAVERIGDVDVVVMGDSDWEPSVISALAGLLGRPVVTGVIACEVTGDTIALTSKNGGTLRIVEGSAPVFIGCKALSKESAPPSMKQTLAARKKPVETISRAELGVGESSGLDYVRTLGEGASSAQIIEGVDVESACADLVRLLHSVGVLA